MTTIFIAHARQTPDAELSDYLHGLAEELETRNPGATAARMFDLALARDDFQVYGLKFGWDNWARSIAAVSNAATRTPRFHVIVVPVATLPGLDERGSAGLPVGRATIQIIDHARKAGRTLRAYVADRRLGDRMFPIVGARTVEGGSWQSGWMLTVERAVRPTAPLPGAQP